MAVLRNLADHFTCPNSREIVVQHTVVMFFDVQMEILNPGGSEFCTQAVTDGGWQSGGLQYHNRFFPPGQDFLITIYFRLFIFNPILLLVPHLEFITTL